MSHKIKEGIVAQKALLEAMRGQRKNGLMRVVEGKAKSVDLINAVEALDLEKMMNASKEGGDLLSLKTGDLLRLKDDSFLGTANMASLALRLSSAVGKSQECKEVVLWLDKQGYLFGPRNKKLEKSAKEAAAAGNENQWNDLRIGGLSYWPKFFKLQTDNGLVHFEALKSVVKSWNLTAEQKKEAGRLLMTGLQFFNAKSSDDKKELWLLWGLEEFDMKVEDVYWTHWLKENQLDFIKKILEVTTPSQKILELLAGSGCYTGDLELVAKVAGLSDYWDWSISVSALSGQSSKMYTHWLDVIDYKFKQEKVPLMVMAILGCQFEVGWKNLSVLETLASIPEAKEALLKHPSPFAISVLSVSDILKLSSFIPDILLPNKQGWNIAHVWAKDPCDFTEKKIINLCRSKHGGLLFQENEEGITPLTIAKKNGFKNVESLYAQWESKALSNETQSHPESVKKEKLRI